MKTFRKAISAAIFVAAFSSVSVPVLANKNTGYFSAKVAVAGPAVSYVKSDENKATFLVTYNPGEKAEFELSVHDVNGDAVYRKYFNTDNFSSLVTLGTGDGDVKDYYFTIRVLPTGAIYNFDVNSTVKLVKNVVVVKQ